MCCCSVTDRRGLQSIAVGLFPFAAMLNHRCAPNACAATNGKTLAVSIFFSRTFTEFMFLKILFLKRRFCIAVGSEYSLCCMTRNLKWGIYHAYGLNKIDKTKSGESQQFKYYLLMSLKYRCVP